MTGNTGRPCVYVKVVKKAEANAVKVVNSVKAAVDKLNEQLPGGMELVWVTDDGRFIEASVQSAWSNVGQGILLTAAILESYKQPWLILVTVPLGLIGIVVNNAILIVDGFNVHVRQGVPRQKAMIAASCEQFRPVAMITLAAVLGMLPLAASPGIGAELRTGVGIASVGGILISGILTLLIVPILYDLTTRKAQK